MIMIDWDFVECVLEKVFPEYDVVGIIDIDKDGLEVPVGVEVMDLQDWKFVDVYHEEGGWKVVYDGYGFRCDDFLDVVWLVMKLLGKEKVYKGCGTIIN